MIDENKLVRVKQLVDAASNSLQHAQSLLHDVTGRRGSTSPNTEIDIASKASAVGSMNSDSGGIRIVEGVFDGQNMVGPDGKQYSVPANYASKSKLVEGDLLKLTIDHTGSFIYKQIGPVERDRKTGVLTQDPETDEFRVLAEGKVFKVLLASVTYFKGEPGDEVIVLVPKGKETVWAAVENIIKSISSGGADESHETTVSLPYNNESMHEATDSGQKSIELPDNVDTGGTFGAVVTPPPSTVSLDADYGSEKNKSKETEDAPRANLDYESVRKSEQDADVSPQSSDDAEVASVEALKSQNAELEEDEFERI